MKFKKLLLSILIVGSVSAWAQSKVFQTVYISSTTRDQADLHQAGGEYTIGNDTATYSVRITTYGVILPSGAIIDSTPERVKISSNVFVVGYSSATTYYGDGSNLTGISTSDVAEIYYFKKDGGIGLADNILPWQVALTTGTIDQIIAVVKTASTTTDLQFDILRSTNSGTDFYSIFTTTYTRLEIDINENNSETATNPYVLDSSFTEINFGDVLRLDSKNNGIGTVGLTIGIRTIRE